MAKKTTKHNDDESWTSVLHAFLTNERTRFIAGLVLLIFTVYFALAYISFFFAGAADADKIENLPLSTIVENHVQVDNWAGVRGAWVANVLVNRLFGIPSAFLLLFLGSLGARLMGYKRLSLLKRFLFCASWTVWGAIFLGFSCTSLLGDSFLNPGGMYGQRASDWLEANLGKSGICLALLGSFLVLAILSNKRMLPLLQRFFTFHWLLSRLGRMGKRFVALFRRKEKEEDDEEEEEEMAGEEEGPTPAPTEGTPPMNVSPEDGSFTVTLAPEEEAYQTIGDAASPQSQEEPAQTDTPDTYVDEDNEPFVPEEQGDYDPKRDLSNFHNPTVDLLMKHDSGERQVDYDEQMANQRLIKQTLEEFSIGITSIKATVGPTITLYEVVPQAGVRISKIRNLEDDIMLKLQAKGIRIIAPMPGKGTIGIEVPNKDPQIVSMQSVINSKKFQECHYSLPVALGKTITNEVFMFDLCKMPHLLVAGATGQGKSVGLNAIITSLLYKKHPSELKFVLIDPKMVEFSIYEEIEKHYLAKLPGNDDAIITDCTKVIQTLKSLCQEMDERYDLLKRAHVRDIKEYNDKFIHRRLNPRKGHKYLPYIVVIIDEFGDLIMMAGREIELPIARIAQKARAVGIHMIIATQRPSANIITGMIKANFPARMAFKVASMVDSRTILDQPGANRLIGRGDMLFSQGNDLVRVQCAFVDTPEVEGISHYIGSQTGYTSAFELPEPEIEGATESSGKAVNLDERDPLFAQAAEIVIREQQGSTSFLQRKLEIGYNRAGRLTDQLEAAGIVGAADGSKGRQVLVPDEMSLELILKGMKN